MNTWSRCAAGARRWWWARPCSTPCSPASRTPRRRGGVPARHARDGVSERRVHGAAAVDGEVRVPGDKSISHRALILGALIRGRSYIGNLSPAADVAATARVLQECGGSVRPFGDGRVSLDGAGPGVTLRSPAHQLDCANSGTTMRLMAGVLAAHDAHGDADRRRLPAAPADGAGGGATAGRWAPSSPPMTVTRRWWCGARRRRWASSTTSPVASAQVKSAILLAGLNAQGPTVVHEPLPTRDHTERILRACGADLDSDGAAVTLRPSHLEPFGLRVPGDISAAAFFMVLAGCARGVAGALRGDRAQPGAHRHPRGARRHGRARRGRGGRARGGRGAAGRRHGDRRAAARRHRRGRDGAALHRRAARSSRWRRRRRRGAPSSAAPASCATRNPTASPRSSPGCARSAPTPRRRPTG